MIAFLSVLLNSYPEYSLLYNSYHKLVAAPLKEGWFYVNFKLFFMQHNNYQVLPSLEKPVPWALLFLIVTCRVREAMKKNL